MLNIAVVGVGIMGVNHARVLGALPTARLVAVVDADEDRARRCADARHSRPFGSIQAMLDGLAPEDRPTAAVVAVPTERHLEVAGELLAAGVHVLVEKPLARTSLEAEELVRQADAARLTLMVGHVERFNACVMELQRLTATPVHIEATRISPFSPRVVDSVVLDLMIHDLDIVGTLAGAPARRVSAVARRSRSAATDDIAVALVEYDNGVMATLTASRLGQQKIRQIELTLPDSYVVADLVRQDLSMTRVDHVEYVSGEGARYRQSAAVEIPFLEHRGEPLLAELSAFVDAVANGVAPPVIGADGVEALRLVEAVIESARRGVSVEL